jgi:hypothetical protein
VTTRELCERAAVLVGAAARDDLEDVPYVLHMAELPEPYRSAPLGGWAGAHDDLMFRDVIDDLLGWDGRGPTIIVSGSNWPTIAAIALHEAGHVLEHDWKFQTEPSPEIVSEQAFLTWAESPDGLKSDHSRWSHGLRWHRALAHLVSRIPWDPELIDVNELVHAGEVYGFPTWPTIRREFSREVWERRNEPIRAILADPPPVDAVELFRV